MYQYFFLICFRFQPDTQDNTIRVFQFHFFLLQAEDLLEDILSFEASSINADIKVSDPPLNISSDIQVKR